MSEQPEVRIDTEALRLLMQGLPDPVVYAQQIYETLPGLLLTDVLFSHQVHLAVRVAEVDRGGVRLDQEGRILIAQTDCPCQPYDPDR